MKAKVYIVLHIFLVILLSSFANAQEITVAGNDLITRPASLGVGIGFTVILNHNFINSTETITKVGWYTSGVGTGTAVINMRCHYESPAGTWNLRAKADSNISLLLIDARQNFTISLSGCQSGDSLSYYVWTGRSDPYYTDTASKETVWQNDQCDPSCSSLTTGNNREVSVKYFADITPPVINAPNVTLNKPLDSITSINSTINFNYTVQGIGVTLTSCDLYTNSTGTWQLNKTNTSPIINNTFNYFNQSFKEGTYLWNVRCSDNNSNSSFASSNRSFTIDLIELNSLRFQNFVDSLGNNYTRNLTYLINITCPDISTTYINRYIDNVRDNRLLINCNNLTQNLIGYYQHNTEGLFNISFKINTTLNPSINNQSSLNHSFISDLNAPNITMLNISVVAGFSHATNNITYTCTDTISPILNHTLIFNDIVYYNSTTAANTTITNTTPALNGLNNLSAICRDFFSNVNASQSKTIFQKTIILIDEIDNIPFALNVSTARVYFDDNSTFYDFKNTSTSQVNFTTIDNDLLRVELGYSDGSIITRYIDVSILPRQELRICANKEGITHYEQIAVSALSKVVIIENQFSNCFIAIDRTRFASEGAFILKSFSINGVYTLFTFDSLNSLILLASLDGSIAAFINIDTLEFNQQGYNLDILKDSIAFKKIENQQQIEIYYNNLANDNTEITLNIERLDTSENVLSNPSISNPNEFTLIFDYSGLVNVTNETIFKLNMITVNNLDVTNDFNSYFTISGSSGSLRPEYAFVTAFILLFFGLSITITRLTFSWFGVIICLLSLSVTTAAVITWYLLMLQGMTIIILIYIFILMINKNNPTVA